MNCLIQIFKSQSLQQLLLWVWETLVKDFNRLKLVLVQKKRTVLWLAGELGASPVIVSKW